jgi:hypothetical protein
MVNSLVASFLANFRRGVSQARFQPYEAASPSSFDAAINYYWNIALSESLYPAFAAFEIALRNTIHDAFTAMNAGNDFWFRVVLEPTHLREYAAAHANLINGGIAKPTSGKIVAELKFWFWTSMLSSLYHNAIWLPNKYAQLHAAFPHLPTMPNPRHAVYERCNDIRLLRNRVMHHEPIWNGMTFQRRRAQPAHFAIDQLHAHMLNAITWINSDIRRSIDRFDRFGYVFKNGRADIERDIKAEFGIP